MEHTSDYLQYVQQLRLEYSQYVAECEHLRVLYMAYVDYLQRVVLPPLLARRSACEQRMREAGYPVDELPF